MPKSKNRRKNGKRPTRWKAPKPISFGEKQMIKAMGSTIELTPDMGQAHLNNELPGFSSKDPLVTFYLSPEKMMPLLKERRGNKTVYNIGVTTDDYFGTLYVPAHLWDGNETVYTARLTPSDTFTTPHTSEVVTPYYAIAKGKAQGAKQMFVLY